MDEKPSIPSNDIDQHQNEKISPGGPLETPTPGELSDGRWAIVTQAHYDPEDSTDLTTVIIGAIADAEGVRITDVKTPPLYEVVDIAAIETALFSRPEANRAGTMSSVEFRYNEHKVTVADDGWVTVSDHTSDASTNGG